MTYTKGELAEISAGIARKLQIPAGEVAIVEGINGFLTVKIHDHEFTGTLSELWTWLDELVDRLSPSPEFEP